MAKVNSTCRDSVAIMKDTDMERILVWDWPTRLGHWGLVLAFAVAYLTGDSEEWRLVHVWAGGALAGIIGFRIAWGLVGTRHARFASFVRGPAAAIDYIKALLRGQAPHFTGHNPAGGWAILALLGLGLGTAATGWPLYQDLDIEAFEDLHEGLVNAMLALVGVHLAGVVVGSLAHRENLARAMLTGWKQGQADEAIRSGRAWALLILAASAGLSAWWFAL